MKNIFRLIFIMMAQVVFMSSCVIDSSEEVTPMKVGDRIPQFTITLNDGTELPSSSLEGKVSVIVFFNTLCGDCRNELPVLQRFYEAYGDRVTVVCISRKQGEDIISEYWKANSLTLPYSAQEDDALYKKFAGSVIPRDYVVGPDLIVRNIFTDSPIATFEELAQAVEALM